MLTKLSNIAPSDIVSLRLVTGDEVLGEYISESSTSIELKNPRVVKIVPDTSTSSLEVYFIPLLLSAINKTIDINKNTVVCYTKSDQQATAAYKNNLNSLESNNSSSMDSGENTDIPQKSKIIYN